MDPGLPAEQRAAKLAMQRQQQKQQQEGGGGIGIGGPVGPSPFGVAPKNYVPGMGRGASGGGAGADTDDPLGNNHNNSQNAQNGASRSRARGAEGQYDDEDEEADRIYESIDERMKKRRKENNKNSNNNDLSAGDTNSSVQKINNQFRELKQQLANVSEAEWASIPDVGDYSLKYKQNRKRERDTFTPISDSLLESRAKGNADATSGNTSTLAGTAQVQVQGGMGGASSSSSSGMKSVAVSNMSGLAEARGTVLGMSLDRMSDSIYFFGFFRKQLYSSCRMKFISLFLQIIVFISLCFYFPRVQLFNTFLICCFNIPNLLSLLHSSRPFSFRTKYRN